MNNTSKDLAYSLLGSSVGVFKAILTEVAILRHKLNILHCKLSIIVQSCIYNGLPEGLFFECLTDLNSSGLDSGYSSLLGEIIFAFEGFLKFFLLKGA